MLLSWHVLWCLVELGPQDADTSTFGQRML